ncbi:MAG TPA: twin-arginine translocase TatA/TatE family subunit [Candidatus Eisenbacteria bacterium]|nr:twin-arginine translocase TatA/TatE family subunit [Candidatus Eisenbacteria bacterium]
MGEFSIFHWLVVLAVVLIFFGGRRIPEVMKGLGEGIRSFKDGVSGGTASVTTAPAPAATSAPTGITAKPGQAQVALSWNASTGASSYNVKRSGTSGGPYALIVSTGSTSYTDEGLANGTFYYVVSAVGPYGESMNSVEVTGTPS